MSGMDCEAVRDLLPLLTQEGQAGSDRATVEAHLRACASCRADAELLALLRRHTLKAPPDLATQILDAHAAQPRGWRPAARHYALAAVLAGALLLGGLLRGDRARAPATASEADPEAPGALLQSFWPGDDGLVAGITPSLHELSVDDLELLIAELGS